MSKTPVLWFAVLLAVAVTAAVIDFFAASGWDDAGQRGDFWGGHFAVVSAALFVFALLSQQKELALQREELRLTRDELRETRRVSEAQRDSLDRQALATERGSVISSFLSIAELEHRMLVVAKPGDVVYHQSSTRFVLEILAEEAAKFDSELSAKIRERITWSARF